MSVLEVSGLTSGFGVNQVLHGVDLTLEAGRTAVLLGLNGAGKSVTLKTISGLVGAWDGRVAFDGRDVTAWETEDRVRAGLGHVLQTRSVFPLLTVEENLRLGGAILRDRRRYRTNLDRVVELFPRLGERMRQETGTLSGGERAMLAIGRALVAEPRVLLVDEPSAGLAPAVVLHVEAILRKVQETGTALCVVEQNVGFALGLADDVHVMERGRIVYSGRPATLDRDRIASLLGIGSLLASGGKGI